MLQSDLWKIRIPAFAGFFLISLCLGLGLKDYLADTGQLLRRVEKQISKDFQEKITEAEEQAPEVLRTWLDSGQLPRKEDKDFLYLIFNREGLLLDWDDPDAIPSQEAMGDLFPFPGDDIFLFGTKSWYVHREKSAERLLVTLIPISIRYNSESNYLPTYVFLGRYDSDFYLQQHGRDFLMKFRDPRNANSLRISNEDGSSIFHVLVRKPDLFRYAQRSWTLIFGFLGFGLALLGLYHYLKKEMAGPWSGAIVLGTLLAVRIGLIALGLPNTYLPIKMFSPALLAVNSWNASIGDLSLNVILSFLFLFYMSKNWFPKLTERYLSWVRKPGLNWVLHVLHLLGAALVVSMFFRIQDTVLENTSIYFEFVNIFRLDFFSLLLFLNIGGILASALILMLQFLRYSMMFLRLLPQRLWFKVVFSVLVLAIFGFIFWEQELLLSIATVVAPTFALLLVARLKNWQLIRMDFVSFLLLVLLFSFMETVAVVRGTAGKRLAGLELAVDRVTEERDLVMESLFNQSINSVYDASLLLQYGLYPDSAAITNDFGKWLKEEYFQSLFKGYRLDVYVYDSTGARIDRLDKTPHVKLEPGKQPEGVGEIKVNEKLVFLPDRGSRFSYIYLGLLDLFVKDLGKINVQLELFPTQFEMDKLYPQLLLDRKVRAQSMVPVDYEFAVYRKGRLSRKSASAAYPVNVRDMPDLPISDLRVIRKDGVLNLYYRAEADKLVWVRGNGVGLYEGANIFSFIFYFFILAFVLIFSPIWVVRRLQSGKSVFNVTLRTRIQVFLLFISIIPLLVVIFFLTPYLRNRFLEDSSSSLLQETSRLGTMLSEKYLGKYGDVERAEEETLEELSEHLEELEKEIFKDINFYDHLGRNRFTTQPAIYVQELTSGFMNPEVYRSLRRGDYADMVIVDQLGKVEYYSAYYPLTTGNYEIMGFLNIPYLSQQDNVNEEILSLLTFLVNIYVLVFLSIGIVGITLSNALTRPLLILQKKMVETRLGGKNEPIEWERDDEIGEMIRSYNKMLETLAENEKKLAASQREQAWQSMARQVAHEIKNPLTPMKLSIQHLSRSWRTKPGNLDAVFDKVTKTLLRQIDSLVNIANSFSEFAKMPEPKKSLFTLQDVIREVTDLYSATENVQIEVHLPEQEFFVHSDRDQLSRVFNNLVKNAIQAMEKESGRIDVSMKIEADLAKVEVKDNGKGIPDDVAEKIFQPNFSTKSSGMGLGLAIVRRIIESAEGKIDFSSKVGEGTTFYIELPRAEGETS